MAELWVVDRSHALYPAIVELRYRVLREPLGIARTQMDLSGDAHCVYVAALEAGTLTGVVALDLATQRLRQMAVAPDAQKRGLGRRLVARLEEEARARGITTLTLHAREVAREFYLKLGYRPRGEPFSEVGIPHIVMDKLLL